MCITYIYFLYVTSRSELIDSITKHFLLYIHHVKLFSFSLENKSNRIFLIFSPPYPPHSIDIWCLASRSNQWERDLKSEIMRIIYLIWLLRRSSVVCHRKHNSQLRSKNVKRMEFLAKKSYCLLPTSRHPVILFLINYWHFAKFTFNKRLLHDIATQQFE